MLTGPEIIECMIVMRYDLHRRQHAAIIGSVGIAHQRYIVAQRESAARGGIDTIIGLCPHNYQMFNVVLLQSSCRVVS